MRARLLPLFALSFAALASAMAPRAEAQTLGSDSRAEPSLLSRPVVIPARPGAIPRHSTDSEREVRQELFDAIVKFNVDYWNEAYAKKLLLLDASTGAELDRREADVRAASAAADASRKQQLRVAASRRPANEDSVDAALRLAVILAAEAQRSAEVGTLLDGVIDAMRVARLPRAQEWMALHLRAVWHFSGGRIDAAARDFEALRRASETAGPSAAGFAFHARLGLGDVAYARFLYTRAEEEYVAALREFQRTALGVFEELSPTLPGLYARLVWSSFRAGRSFSTSIYATEYARRKSTFPRALPKGVEDELVRAGGIALYERGDVPFSKSLAGDALAGDLGKRLLLETLNEHIRARSFAAGEALARAMEREFEESPYAFDFGAARAVLAENGSGSRAKAERDFRTVMLASRDSRWTRAFARTKALDGKRRQTLLRLAGKTGAFFAEEGRRTGRKDDFLKSHLAYRARLGDAFEDEDRGALLLASSDSAFRAGVHESAWEDARLAFRQPLGDDAEREAFVLLARASGAQAEGALSLADPYLNRHLGAVDAFLSEMPEAREAREFLFALAGKLERIGALAVALARYERVLASVPRRGDDSRVELENVLRALCVFHMRHSEPEAAAPALSALESVAREAGVEAVLLQDLHLASAAQVRLEAAAERRAGRLEKAAGLLRQWSARNLSNPEAPLILRDAVAGFREVGDARAALEAAAAFLGAYGGHPYVWDLLRLKGLVHESALAFHAAALSYVAAAYNDASRLDPATRIALLRKAGEFLSQGGNAKEAAGVYERVAVLAARFGDGSGSSWEGATAGRPARDASSAEMRAWEARDTRSATSAWLARAAGLRARAGETLAASRLYVQAARLVPARSEEASRLRLSALRARLEGREPTDGDAEEALALASQWPSSRAARVGRNEALVFALELDNHLLDRTEDARGPAGTTGTTVGIGRSARTGARARILARVGRLEVLVRSRSDAKGTFAEGRKALATPGPAIQDSTGSDPSKADAAATKAALLLARLDARLRPESRLARSLTFEAFLAAPKGSEMRAEAARALRAYAPVTSGDLPPEEPLLTAGELAPGRLVPEAKMVTLSNSPLPSRPASRSDGAPPSDSTDPGLPFSLPETGLPQGETVP